MPEKKVDGVKKIDRDQLEKSRKIILSLIGENANYVAQPIKENISSTLKKVDGVLSGKLKQKTQEVQLEEQKVLSSNEMKKQVKERMSFDFVVDKNNKKKEEEIAQKKEQARLAEEERMKEIARQEEQKRLEEIKKEENKKAEALQREQEEEIKKQELEKKQAKEEQKNKEIEDKKRKEIEKIEAEKKAAEEKIKKSIKDKEKKEKEKKRREKEKKQNKEKRKKVIANFSESFKFFLRKVIYFFAELLVIVLIFYILFVILITRFKLDNNIVDSLLKYIPVPALVTKNDIIKYDDYQNARKAVIGSLGTENIDEKKMKVLIIERIVLNGLAKKYALDINGFSLSEAKEVINKKIIQDKEINQVALNRMEKIKQMIVKDDDFVKIATKYGDELGQLTLSPENESFYSYSSDLKKLKAGEISGILNDGGGYYIFRSYGTDEFGTNLSYVFIKGKNFDEYFNELIVNYKFWSLVD